MKKVFLVEDEIVIREAIHRIVPWGDYGFELVGEAKDGEMALPMIKKTEPDVVITDIKMPFMDGLTLSRVIKKEFPETKIIIISGYDDFEYARQAIALGVEEYLLKPVSKSDFIKVLEKIKIEFEKENAKKDYYEKFRKEMQEYEKNSRRDFFEMLMSGQRTMETIFERAEQLQIEIMASRYNIVLFSMGLEKDSRTIGDMYSDAIANLQIQIDEMFQKDEEYMLFRNQMYSYAVFIRGEESNILELTERCIHSLRNVFEKKDGKIDWFICQGSPVDRLSQLPVCYKEAMKNFAFRFMGYSHVFVAQNIHLEKTEDINLNNIDVNLVDPNIIRNFLCNAEEEELESFVTGYMDMVGEEALKSRLFRQYLILNIHFCAISFVQSLGYEKECMEEELVNLQTENLNSLEHLLEAAEAILGKAINMREQSTKGKYKSVIQKAVTFMEEHFTDDSLTLNQVACAANVSANHFSALFSQEMEQTFIEYLTNLRMKKAKELLRCTNLRSGEIALEVGYKDAHYFSFLFKKIQGTTPSEYRNRGGKGSGENGKR